MFEEDLFTLFISKQQESLRMFKQTSIGDQVEEYENTLIWMCEKLYEQIKTQN